ncbi:HEAT repeat domain-containing protein [Brevibacterium litoralis]|uniref:HEAT repeat domain-containing protein n=1 Tax=Brevibacterium litoralis TaxID=3138935 RepID=UPI0032ED7B1C
MTAPALRALTATDPSDRLQAALSLGTHPDPAQIEELVARCGVEPDFYVRDMLTWALTRHPHDLVVPPVLAELTSPVAQARSQALHTLSKIGDPATWDHITEDHLRDPDDQVARTAWRAAVAVVPVGIEPELARLLVTQLGRGDRDVQLSLSRALADLGDHARRPLESIGADDPETVHAHAIASLRALDDPEETFTVDVEEAKRVRALGDLA